MHNLPQILIFANYGVWYGATSFSIWLAFGVGAWWAFCAWCGACGLPSAQPRSRSRRRSRELYLEDVRREPQNRWHCRPAAALIIYSKPGAERDLGNVFSASGAPHNGDDACRLSLSLSLCESHSRLRDAVCDTHRTNAPTHSHRTV